MSFRVPPLVRVALVLGVLVAIGSLWLGLRKHRSVPPRSHEASAAPAPVRPTPPAPTGQPLHAAARKPKRGHEEWEREKDKDKDKEPGERPFDEPMQFARFNAMKRIPYGATTIPVDRYFTALEHNSNMPQYSSALGVTLPPQGVAGPDNTAVSSWTNLGPGNIGGRVRALLINPTSPSTMYAAGVAGGVWKTTDGGSSWTSVGGTLPNLAVNSMAMDPKDPNTIYAGTGEGYFNIDSVRGAGIFVTNNGGGSWSPLGSTSNDSDFYFVNKLVVSPVSSSRIYAATETGVFQSTNSGTSWTRVLNSSSNNGCFDLAMRTDQSTDYIFASCGTFSQAYIWRNTDAAGAGTWSQVFTGGSNMGLTSIAISPSNQAHIYALASTTASGNFQDGLLAVYASTNSGTSWTTQYANSGSGTLADMLLTNYYAANCDGTYISQGWYDNVIAVDPANENTVWVGGIDLFRSGDGGKTWGLASYWWTGGSNYEHADQHAIAFLPTDDGQTMFVGSDGGVFQTSNRTAALGSSACSASGSVTWKTLDHNIGITQFYDGAVFPDGQTFFGGTQDNGTNKGTVGGGANAWTSILGGDGGYVAVDPTNTSILYGEYTGLSIQKSTNGGSSWNDATSGISDSGFLFIAPFTLDPNNHQQLWTGGNFIWTTSNGASSWTKAGSGLNATVSAIAVATGNSNKVAVGTSSGTIYYSINALSGSPTWSNSTPSNNNYVSWVAYDPNNSSILYATYSTFGSGHVFKSTNGGSSWTDIDGSGSTGLPDVPALSIVVNPANSQMLFVATDVGVYSSTTGGNTWNVETTGFGNASTDSLTLVNLSGNYSLYAFTHGFGVWSAPVLTAGVCSFTLSPDQNVPASGGSGSVTVTTQTGCAWSAVSNNTAWLTVPSGSGNGSGNGTGSFNWAAAANAGVARSGTITVNGTGGSATFTVNQTAATYAITGQVTLGGSALAGVTMTLTGSASGNNTTNSGGNYTFTETAGGTYTVTPSLTGYGFTPTSQTVNNLTAATNLPAFNANNVTVTTNPPGLSVSLDGGPPLPAPQSVYWAPGSTTHTVSVASPQPGPSGSQYTWASWSDTGAQTHAVSVPNSGTLTVTATFTTQYLLTTAVSPSGAGTITANPSSATGYYDSGTSVQLTEAPLAGFTFAGWSGDLSGTSNGQSVTMNAPRSVTATFNSPSPVTVTTSPSGLSVIVDNVTYPTSPQSFTWTSGTQHSIGVPSPQGSGGTSNIFATWSDAGAQSHNVTAPAGAVVYTAAFTTEYQLTTTASPAAGGTIAASPTSPDGFYASGTSVQLTATPAAGYLFTSWGGDLSGSVNPQTITMSGVHSVTANFTPLTAVTVTTAPSGLAIVVDGSTLTAPQVLHWAPGSQHTLNVTSPQQGTGTQNLFASWSDGGAQSHTVTTPASAIAYTATFSQQYLLTATATPSSGGSVAASPTSSDGYYASGTVVQLTANPSPNYQFSNWGRDLSGSANPQSIAMNAPHTVMATFAQPVPIVVSTVPAGLSVQVDGNTVTGPQTFNWFPGSNHTLNATSPQGTTPHYAFASWSDSGAQSHSIAVTSSGATYTATFNTQYLLTAVASPPSGGDVLIAPSSPDGYYNAGTLVQLTASTKAGYNFTGWSGDLTGTDNPKILTMDMAHTATANFTPTAGITVTTNPSGLQVIVDGNSYTTPQSFSWSPGSNHTLNLVSPQGTGGTTNLFANWSDAGAQSHTVTAPSTPITYTATFTTEYQLTTSVAPSAAGTVAASPTSSNGFYASGASVQLTATANTGYQFANWSGDLTGATNPQTITTAAPHTVTANFTALTAVTVATNPSGRTVIVDGNTVTTPQVFQWAPGSSHAFSVTSPQATGTGARAAFSTWSDAGAQSHSITVPSSPATYTANFNSQYLLTATASPAAGGSISASPSSIDNYYNSGTAVQLTAQPNPTYQFTGWSGDLSGAANPQSLTMSAPHSVAANFAAPVSITVTTLPAGLSVIVDNTPVSTPQVFSWLSGSTHTLSLTSPQGVNPRYVFTAWSDSGAATHTITAPSVATTYTATFAGQYLLTTAVTPSGAGSITGSPSSADGYYNSGTLVQLTATANSGYQFAGWSGDLSGAANPQSVSMSASHTVTANFNATTPSCSLSLSPPSASLPATGSSTVETCPNNSGQPNCGVTPEIPRTFTVTPSAACGAWTATSSVPSILQVTAGSGSGAGPVSYSLLNNTHTLQQSYTITVTSGAASSTFPVTESGSGDSEVYRQVYALYEGLLGRDPDPAGFAFWSGSGGAGLGQMADSFLTSPEAFNSDFVVMAAYQAATGAPPTYAQFTSAVTQLRAGTQPVVALFNSLTVPGYTAATLYQNLLARSPTAAEINSANAAGLAQWFQTLIGYPNNTTPVNSPNNEFQSTGTFHTDHSNALYMQMVYYVTLGRNPDPGGFAFWLGIANSGGPGVLFQGAAGYATRIQILGPGTPNQGFIGSPEFQGLFAN